MFRITQDPSSWGDNLYLIEITYNVSNVLIMCMVGFWRYMPPNTDQAHNKHIWTVICNFNQVQVITPDDGSYVIRNMLENFLMCVF